MTLDKTETQPGDLQKMAFHNDGHCDRCGRIIKIYKYNANKQMATVLRAMRQCIEDTSKNEVNFERLPLAYELKSQRTKMRLHGLIAKFKNAKGEHVGNTWLITKKGGDWLRGLPIAKTVIVFDNQVLGHSEDVVTIATALHDPDYQAEPISSPVAEVLHDIREPERGKKIQARFIGYPSGGYAGRDYDLVIDKLVVGHPLKILSPIERTYTDIARFLQEWKIIENGGLSED